jgi:hypothetical protein
MDPPSAPSAVDSCNLAALVDHRTARYSFSSSVLLRQTDIDIEVLDKNAAMEAGKTRQLGHGINFEDRTFGERGL